jgi:hypothetical protein
MGAILKEHSSRPNICAVVKAKSFSSKRPLPLGEGWGEGLASTTNQPTPSFFSLRFAPSPWPSPKGRGNKKLAYQRIPGARCSDLN